VELASLRGRAAAVRPRSRRVRGGPAPRRGRRRRRGRAGARTGGRRRALRRHTAALRPLGIARDRRRADRHPAPPRFACGDAGCLCPRGRAARDAGSERRGRTRRRLCASRRPPHRPGRRLSRPARAPAASRSGPSACSAGSAHECLPRRTADGAADRGGAVGRGRRGPARGGAGACPAAGARPRRGGYPSEGASAGAAAAQRGKRPPSRLVGHDGLEASEAGAGAGDASDALAWRRGGEARRALDPGGTSAPACCGGLSEAACGAAGLRSGRPSAATGLDDSWHPALAVGRAAAPMVATRVGSCVRPGARRAGRRRSFPAQAPRAAEVAGGRSYHGR
jgi:hypothetical protein